MIDETEHQRRILLARRFPVHTRRILLGLVKSVEAASPGDAEAVSRAYSELSRLPAAELKEMYWLEVDQIRAEAGWLSRFLGQWAPPDYDHWATMPLWSMDEAALLLLDRDPEAVKVPLEETTLTGKDHWEFGRLRDVLERAVASGQLNWRTDPPTVLRWVLDRGISVPDRLEQAVREKTQFVDWQAVAQTELEQHKAVVEDLQKKLQGLEADLERLQSEKRRDRRAERSERIVLFAIARAKPYSFRPNQDTSPGTVALLDRAIAEAGLELDHDTILAALRRAAAAVEQYRADEAGKKIEQKQKPESE